MRIRTCIALLAISAFVAAAHAQSAKGPAGPDFKVTLLGTGSPPPIMNRFGPGTLVQVNGQNLLFDAGRGVTQRLLQSKLKLGDVTALFLTHLHSVTSSEFPTYGSAAGCRPALAGARSHS